MQLGGMEFRIGLNCLSGKPGAHLTCPDRAANTIDALFDEDLHLSKRKSLNPSAPVADAEKKVTRSTSQPPCPPT